MLTETFVRNFIAEKVSALEKALLCAAKRHIAPRLAKAIKEIFPRMGVGTPPQPHVCIKVLKVLPPQQDVYIQPWDFKNPERGYWAEVDRGMLLLWVDWGGYPNFLVGIELGAQVDVRMLKGSPTLRLRRCYTRKVAISDGVIEIATLTSRQKVLWEHTRQKILKAQADKTIHKIAEGMGFLLEVNPHAGRVGRWLKSLLAHIEKTLQHLLPLKLTLHWKDSQVETSLVEFHLMSAPINWCVSGKYSVLEERLLTGTVAIPVAFATLLGGRETQWKGLLSFNFHFAEGKEAEWGMELAAISDAIGAKVALPSAIRLLKGEIGEEFPPPAMVLPQRRLAQILRALTVMAAQELLGRGGN